MDYIIILILLAIFVYCHFYTREKYVVLSNNKLIPNDMLNYQKINMRYLPSFLMRLLQGLMHVNQIKQEEV